MSSGAIKVVPADFQAASAELESLVQSLGKCKKALEESYASMRAGWHGAAADAFEARYFWLFLGFDGVLAKMEDCAQDIRMTGETMQAIDDMAAGFFSFISSAPDRLSGFLDRDGQ
ncbi:MAG: WXG100 family type VII secretion target [Coriobacteriaceae bacterium]|jgi:WXG100 family type VII secretion target|nr:WXG100 family type VII secretion target [Coriobacteriaceae bacterium]